MNTITIPVTCYDTSQHCTMTLGKASGALTAEVYIPPPARPPGHLCHAGLGVNPWTTDDIPPDLVGSNWFRRGSDVFTVTLYDEDIGLVESEDVRGVHGMSVLDLLQLYTRV